MYLCEEKSRELFVRVVNVDKCDNSFTDLEFNIFDSELNWLPVEYVTSFRTLTSHLCLSNGKKVKSSLQDVER